MGFSGSCNKSKEEAMPSAKHVSNFLNNVGYSSGRVIRLPDPDITNIHHIFKKTKALTDSTGERLAGIARGSVFALPLAEGNGQKGILEHGHSAILDIRPDSPEMYIGPAPIQRRWGLRRVAHCLAGS